MRIGEQMTPTSSPQRKLGSPEPVPCGSASGDASLRWHDDLEDLYLTLIALNLRVCSVSARSAGNRSIELAP